MSIDKGYRDNRLSGRLSMETIFPHMPFHDTVCGDGTCLAVGGCVESIQCHQAAPCKPMAYQRYDDCKYQTPASFKTSKRRGNNLKLAGWRGPCCMVGILRSGSTPYNTNIIAFSCSSMPGSEKNQRVKADQCQLDLASGWRAILRGGSPVDDCVGRFGLQQHQPLRTA